MKAGRFINKFLAFILCMVMLSQDTLLAAEVLSGNMEDTETMSETFAHSNESETREIPVEETSKSMEETAKSVNTEVLTEVTEQEDAQMTNDTQSTETAGASEMDETSTEEIPVTEVAEETETTENTKDDTEAQVRFDYKSDLVNVVVTLNDGKDLPENAQLVVTPLEVTEEMQNTIRQSDEENTASVKKMTAFDISFVADGIEVEPGATVKVQLSLPEVEAGDHAEVYHYDENTNAVEDMQAEVTADGTVAFDTPHFSTYIIVNEGEDTVTVTISHIDSNTGKKIYADDVRQLTVGARINDYKKANNWNVKKVTSVESNEEREIFDTDEIEIRSDTVIKVYYEAIDSTVDGGTTFFDYLVKPMKNGYGEKPEWSFNTISNYSNQNTQDSTTRLIAGTKSQNYTQNQYDALCTVNGVQKNANQYVGGRDGLVPGLVIGLTEDTKNVVFSMDEPGFFSMEEKTGKNIIEGYTLQFERAGDTYRLLTVKDDKQNVVANAGDAFFPLDAVTYDAQDNGYGTAHNYYFGMRYDIMFTLGDYVGPLNYSFTGDDDLWVILDGKQVVVDLGGIHDALSASVNLWDALGMEEGIGATTEEAQNQEHRLTILYMERGANASNCQMNFTIPSAEIVSVTSTTTNLTLNKVNTSGEALAGAGFKLVNDTNGNVISALSQTDGTMTFRNLRVGTYTLSETVAPDGYTATPERWKVKVTAEGENIVARVYLSDGVTELTDNKIVNKTTGEYLDEALEYDKKATLTDWDNRTYDITLSASSLSEYTIGGDTTITNIRPKVDVVLVLDVSGSMNDGTCLADLKNAACDFVQGLYENADPCSQVAIVKFNTGASTVLDLTTLTADNVSEVKRKINRMQANGGTDQSQGLYTANEMLRRCSNENKYVILFTDGQPDTRAMDSSDETPIADAAFGYAREIKQSATLYTIRLGDIAGGDLSYNFLRQYWDWWHWVYDYEYNNRTYVQWLTDLATAEKYALNVADSSQLSNIFKQIQAEVTTPKEVVRVALTEVNVVDVIDARFELTEDEKNRLMADGAVIENNIDGTTAVKWLNQTVNAKTKDDTDVPGWCKVIHVKAKDDYIGGNAVATNVNPGSYVEVSGEKKEFEQPSVNVKVNLEVENHLEEIFLGESVPTEPEILKNLMDVDRLLGRYGVDESKITLNWYEDQQLLSEISLEDMANVKPDMDGAKYYLKVTYDAGVPTEESNRNSIQDSVAKYNGSPDCGYKTTAVNKSDASLNYGIYTIKVIDGKIVIAKEITEGSYKKIQGDPIFTFRITNTDSGKVYYRTVRFKDEDTTALTTTVEHLEKGHYLIEELDTIRYDMTGRFVMTSDTGCAYKCGDTDVTFAIGYTQPEVAGAGYVAPRVVQPTGRVGSVTFTNAKMDESRELTDTDVVKNTFAVGMVTSATKDADNNR